MESLCDRLQWESCKNAVIDGSSKVFMSAAAKFGFALHTTTPQLGLSLIDVTTGTAKTQVWDLGRALASELHSYLQDFIAPQGWQELAFVAVAKGPGGFTGTRIGVVTARTLAQQLDVPLYGISTLAAIAFRFAKQNIGQTVAVSLPARRDELFGAIYRVHETGLETLVTDQLFTPEIWAETQNTFPHLTVLTPPEELGITVENVLELAYLQWQKNPISPWGEVVPFYGQHPVYKNSPH